MKRVLVVLAALLTASPAWSGVRREVLDHQAYRIFAIKPNPAGYLPFRTALYLQTGGLPGAGNYREDTAHTSGQIGFFMLAVRNDAGTAPCSDGDYCPFSLDASGNLRVTTGSGGTSSNFGSAFPTPGTAAGFHDGTNMQGARVFDLDTGGGTQYGLGVNLRKIASGGSVEAGTSSDPLRVDPTGTTAQPATQSGTWNINNVSGTISLPTGAATSANQSTEITALQLIDNLPNTIGSTTSGQSGALALGAVTTAAPTYTTAQSHPLSLDTAGALRVNVTSGPAGGTSQADNSAVTTITGIGALYDTTPPSITDGNVGLPRMNSNRQLMVDIAAVSAAGSVDDTATLTPGTTEGTPMMGAVTTDVVDSGDLGIVRMSATRDLSVTVKDSAGDNAMDDANNAMRVNIVAGGGSGGTAQADRSTFTDGTTTATPVAGVYNETNTNPTEDQAAAVRITVERAMHTNIRDISADRGAVVLDTGANDSLAVAIVDASGNQVVPVADNSALGNASAMGALYDTTPPAITDGNVGLPRMSVNRDLRVQPVDGQGDSAADDANNAVRVNIVAGAGSGGTAQADRSTFTDGTTNFTPIGGTFDETNTNPTEDQGAAVRITDERAFHVNLRNNTGGEIGVAGDPVNVEGTVTANAGTGTFTVSDPTYTDATGTSVPANAAFVGGTDGTNTRALKTDGNGELQVDVLSMPVQNVQYIEDDPSSANPTGTVPLLVRDDAPNTQTTTDGDQIAQRGTNYGAAYVQVVTSTGSFIDSFGGSGGTSQADRSAFTDGTTNATPVSGVYNETNTNPTEDQAAAVRITVERAMHTNIRDVSADRGAVVLDTGTNDSLAVAIVDASGNQVVPTIDDSAYTAASGAGSPIMGFATSDVVDSGDVGVLRMTTTRDLHTTIRDGAGDSAMDNANDALRVNVVAGAAGGGAAQAQVRNEGDSAWVNVGVGAEGGSILHMPIQIQDDGTDPANVINAAPALTDFGLAVRPVDSHRTATGTLNALNAAVTISGQGASSIVLEIDSGLSGTVTFEATQDDANWFAVWAENVTGGARVSSTVSFPIRVKYLYTGFSQYRARVSSFTSGSSAARMGASAAGGTALVGGGTLDGIAGVLSSAGTKSNNAAGPGGNNLGTLPAIALAAAPTWTEGNQVGVRTQLDGDLVTVMEDELPAGTQNIGDVDVASLPNEGQQTAANSISVTPDTDNDAIGATGAAVPGEAILMAGTDGTNVTVPYIDPCQREARTVYRVDIVTATTTEIAAATASEFYWVCSINLVTAAANNVIIVEDDSATNCPSPTAGVSSGGTTSGEGWNFAANGGIVVGTGQSWIMKTGTANRSFCIITSAATQLSGTITYVSSP